MSLDVLTIPEPLLSPAQVRATGRAIADAQEASGALPWEPGRHVDPWDHIEAAMGLDVAGFHTEADRAYEWLARTQRPDGSWPARIEDGVATDDASEVHHVAYISVGVWHHVLATGDTSAAHRYWPVVDRALNWTLELQRPGGEFAWSRDQLGDTWHEALVTSNASVYLSLRASLALARLVGEERPDQELAAGLLGHALRHHELERFDPRDRWSMDWYYPVLCGAMVGAQARARLRERWDTFVVPGRGARCVADRPWVTVAESCELALALEAVGRRGAAAAIVHALAPHRHEDAGYWTGHEYEMDVHWPEERTTWTNAAVLLAVDAIEGTSPTSRLFHHDALPLGVDPEDVRCEDEARCSPVAVAH